jgi:hypothetical protein
MNRVRRTEPRQRSALQLQIIDRAEYGAMGQKPPATPKPQGKKA